MNISIFLAQLVGPIFVIYGFALLLNPVRFQKIAASFIRNQALMHIGGFLALLIGLFLALIHNYWQKDWRLIISILGWMAFIKGLVIVLLPDEAVNLTKKFIKKTWLIQTDGFFALILGIVLMYVGFIR